MRGDSLIALKIGQRTPFTIASALRPALDRALALIGTVFIAVEDETERRDLNAKLDEFRRAFADAEDAEAVAALTEMCFDMCEHAVQSLQSQQLEHRTELGRIVALVRDTARILVGDGQILASDIAQAATRFNSLLRIDDLQQLKGRLTVEVQGLQRLAVQRQQQWQQSIAMFETRIVSLERQLSAATKEASLDPLTGISNRRHFEEALRQELQAPDRQLVLALIDLDDFKAINDLGGHAAGDRVLERVAHVLKTAVRRKDVVARVGGDEFAVLVSGATLREAEPRLRTIVSALAAIPGGVAGRSHVSVSCGLAEYCAGDTLHSLMRRADQGLYDAKRQGKNRLVVKSPPFIRDLLRRK